MHAMYFVVDERLADMASAAASQMSRHWDCDFHIFVERRCKDAQISEVGGDRIVYHYDRLSGFLPEGLPEFGRWPRIVYLRVFAPQLLNQYRRLLYLDADILAFGADAALWDVDLPDGLGAVADLPVLERGPHGKDRAQWLADIGVQSGRYLNSGVLLIDPKIWNQIDFATLLPEYFAAHPMAEFPDQDFLAHTFDGRWVELSPRFNWLGGVLHWGLTRAVDPVFVHFCMVVRPWYGVQAPWLSPNDPSYVDCYDSVLTSVGYNLDPYRKTFRLPRLRSAKYAFLAWISKKGYMGRRERKKRKEWQVNHQFLRSYLEVGLREGRFAAETRRSLDVPNPDTFWDGRFVRVKDDMPPGSAIGPEAVSMIRESVAR